MLYSKLYLAFEELITPIWEASEHLRGSQDLQNIADKATSRALLATPPLFSSTIPYNIHTYTYTHTSQASVSQTSILQYHLHNF